MPSIGQTWVLASIGAVVEMGVLSTLNRLLMESSHLLAPTCFRCFFGQEQAFSGQLQCGSTGPCAWCTIAHLIVLNGSDKDRPTFLALLTCHDSVLTAITEVAYVDNRHCKFRPNKEQTRSISNKLMVLFCARRFDLHPISHTLTGNAMNV
jgi:hypothetical protein